MPFNIKQMDQSNWVCYHLANNSYFYGQVGYLDQSGIVNPKDNVQAANNPKNKLVKHGFGIFISGIRTQGQQKPQSIYQGYWDKDMKSGKGQLKQFNKNFTYDGSFLEDHYHGNGKMTWKNGDSYDGAWKRSKMDGAGSFKHHDGFILKGLFKANYFIDQDILRNPQMSQKQYISFKKQRKQIIKQKQKQQKVKQGFVCKVFVNNEQQLKQKISKSIKNNRVPLILSSKTAHYNLQTLTNRLTSQFQNIKVNNFDLRRAFTLQGQQKWNYRKQIHNMYRQSLLNGQIFIVNLDQSDIAFQQMYYPDVKQFYEANGFNQISWSRDQLQKPEIKNKIQGLNGQQIHHNYKLIVWTKFKLDKNIKQDFLRQKLQTRYQKIIPFIKIDCIFIREEDKVEQNQTE